MLPSLSTRSPNNSVFDRPSVTSPMRTDEFRWNTPSRVACVGGNDRVPPLPAYVVTPSHIDPAFMGLALTAAEGHSRRLIFIDAGVPWTP